MSIFSIKNKISVVLHFDAKNQILLIEAVVVVVAAVVVAAVVVAAVVVVEPEA